MSPISGGEDAVARFWAGKTSRGHVDFANWSLYMDPRRPELARFTAETAITVEYQEIIEEMVPWYAQIQPRLAEGQPIGSDLMVLTNGIQFHQLVAAGFLAPLDHARLPHFAANVGESYKHASFDPGNMFSTPWASGITGIAYHPDAVPFAPTRLSDLWRPELAGRVGMYADTHDLGNAGMLVLGIDPATSTPPDWHRAADKLREQRDAGIVPRYYASSDLDALERGELWATQAWSGDIFQKNLAEGTNLRFVIPEEGGTIWTDSFTIPVTAANPVDAITLMDFFYRVDVAANLTEYINFISPVPDVARVIREHAAETEGAEREYLERLAQSPLVFPSPADYANLHYYRDFTTVAEWVEYESIFGAVVSGT